MRSKIGRNSKPFSVALLVGLVLMLGVIGLPCSQYVDFPGFGDDTQGGRTKNAIAVLVAGVVGQKIHPNSNIDLTVEKTLFPDSRVSGHTSENSIDTTMSLATTSSSFHATREGERFTGNIDKSEFDWTISQENSSTWSVGRFGLKLDTTLVLECENGKITGRYIRPLAFSWPISGTYSDNGDVVIVVECPFGFGITLRGKIESR